LNASATSPKAGVKAGGQWAEVNADEICVSDVHSVRRGVMVWHATNMNPTELNAPLTSKSQRVTRTWKFH